MAATLAKLEVPALLKLRHQVEARLNSLRDIASSPKFLRSLDTRKDAIDAVAV